MRDNQLKLFEQKRVCLFLLLFIFFNYKSICQELDTAYQKKVATLITTLKSNNKVELARLIAFPIKREYPIPDISNKADFINRYNELFDDTLINLIKVSIPAKNWYKMTEGIMLDNGVVWLNFDGKVTSINYQTKKEKDKFASLLVLEHSKVHPSLSKFEKPLCIIETINYRIRIDQLENGKYRYASWNIKKDMKSNPDLVLSNGEISSISSCGNFAFVFKKDNYTYECNIIRCGTLTSPPALLVVYKGETAIVKQVARLYD